VGFPAFNPWRLKPSIPARRGKEPRMTVGGLSGVWQSVRHLRNVPISSIPSIVPPITFLQAFPVGPAWVAGGFGLTGSAAAPTNRTY
jgi:hypothetical protein